MGRYRNGNKAAAEARLFEPGAPDYAVSCSRLGDGIKHGAAGAGGWLYAGGVVGADVAGGGKGGVFGGGAAEQLAVDIFVVLAEHNGAAADA